MNRFIGGMILILAVMLIIPLQGFAATPKETVETGVNNLLKTPGDQSFKAKPKDERLALMKTQIETVFDFQELSRRTLGRTWKKMSPEQHVAIYLARNEAVLIERTAGRGPIHARSLACQHRALCQTGLWGSL